MIMDFIKKIPAGMMIVPMFIALSLIPLPRYCTNRFVYDSSIFKCWVCNYNWGSTGMLGNSASI